MIAILHLIEYYRPIFLCSRRYNDPMTASYLEAIFQHLNYCIFEDSIEYCDNLLIIKFLQIVIVSIVSIIDALIWVAVSGTWVDHLMGTHIFPFMLQELGYDFAS